MNIKNINFASKLLILALFSQSLLAGKINFIPNDERILLSNEIFEKLTEEHYIQATDEDFNYKYIEHLIGELDDNKRYFTKYEVNRFLNSAKIFNSSKQTFDVSSAYKIINLYFNRLVEYSDYQIYLLEKETFSFSGKDFLDIYSDDNDWQPSKLAPVSYTHLRAHET